MVPLTHPHIEATDNGLPSVSWITSWEAFIAMMPQQLLPCDWCVGFECRGFPLLAELPPGTLATYL